MTNEATLRQQHAADPGGSTWLSANAGSGKTRVLTDRVARLLLEEVPPQNILCLTYTKAAAGEMQNRLFKRLGEWAMRDDARLAADLAALGLTETPDLTRARTLFARALETPGGLKIQTIHAFCAGLLRQFPLEAQVSPQFVEIDARTTALLIDEVLEDLATGPDATALDRLAQHVTATEITPLIAEVTRARAAFAPPMTRDETMAHYGVPRGQTMADIVAWVFQPGTRQVLRQLVPALLASGATDSKAGKSLSSVDLDMPDEATLIALESAFLYRGKAKAPFGSKAGAFPTMGLRGQLDFIEDLDALMDRVESARPQRIALNSAERTAALHGFAGVFLPAYEAAKRDRGWLDFDDLILKARDLLTDPSVAEWVLFRLDGGTDHILVDEAQDTNPVQWQVIELLAREFAAGQGARADVHRTLFVVGDRKQSIYSFQGADPEAFERMFDHFSDRMGDAVQRLELRHSFRSARAILEVVDKTFEADAGTGLGQGARHEAFHDEMPGRVDLWPILPKPDAPPDPEWFDPVDLVPEQDEKRVLADRIASEIKRLIDAGTLIPSSDGPRPPLHEGDILILLQRRSDLFHAIIRACKAKGLAVAGVDRLRIGGELAVRDITALLAFLATPEDDLSLATVLRSPLFGWSEAELYTLAQGRPKGAFLWEWLRKRDGDPTRATLEDLRNAADFLRPYELIERLLTRHEGRARLLGRLGREAEEGVDELLSQALSYERLEVPSLTGFLNWLASGDVEVKRDLGSGAQAIRVMTVHGAKGLEAPVVILPDTLRDGRGPKNDVLLPDEGPPLWSAAADASPPVVRDALDARKAAEAAERKRLLYVAMTRAETWLILCGAGERPKAGGTWYDLLEAGLDTRAVEPLDTPTGPGRRLQLGDWAALGSADTPKDVESHGDLPAWAHQHADPPEAAPEILSPSDLGGPKALPGEPEAEFDTDAALRRGRMLHLLLEHLPEVPETEQRDLATALLSAGPDAGTPEEAAALLGEARQVMAAHPALFAPGSRAEVPVTAPLAALDGRRMHGIIDRLVVTEGAILAVDYKSNRIVPAGPEAIPDGLLRQLGAYHDALAQIFPDRRVEVAILWTRTAALMTVPHDIVSAALQRVATS